METRIEDGDIFIVNDPPWLITNKRICWPDGVVRLSNVRKAAIVCKRGAIEGFIPWILVVHAMTQRIFKALRMWSVMCGLLFFSSTLLAQFTYTTNDLGVILWAYTGSNAAVTVSNFVNVINQEAFYNCTNLTNVIIPGSVTIIETEAFLDCSNLIGITLGTNVSDIEGDIFANCTRLTNIIVDLQNPAFSSEGGVLFNEDRSVLVAYPSGKSGGYTVPNSVTNIGGEAFIGCAGLTGITIGTNVTSIGSGAFLGCTDLTSISIPNGVTSIASSAFQQCTSLTNLFIPDNVTNIGPTAFFQCSSLTSFGIGSNVTVVGIEALVWCTSLTNIIVDSNNTTFASVTGVLFSKDLSTLIQYPGGLVGHYVIPSSVTSIADFAFDGCTNLTGVTIPNTVTNSLGSEVFASCTSLTSITLPNSISTLGPSTFVNCTALTNIAIPDSVTEIGSATFENCTNLTSIFIPASVTTIAFYAFDNCANLTNILVGRWNLVDDLRGLLPTVSEVYFLPYQYSGFVVQGGELWNPTIQVTNQTFGIKSNVFGFTITGTTNIPIVVAATTNLAGGTWTPLQTCVLTNGSMYFADPAWTNYPSRFYSIEFP